MRKPLMMVCYAVFLIAMCFVPSMYGDPPKDCPNQRVNQNPKDGQCPVTNGFDTSNIDKNGNQKVAWQCSDKSYSASPPSAVVPICEAYKPISHVAADRSIIISSGGVASYVDITVNPVLPAGLVYVECFKYYKCTSNGVNGICSLDQEVTEVQVSYSTLSCVQPVGPD